MEADSNLHRIGEGETIEHDTWTGPCVEKETLQQRSSVKVEMNGRELRRRSVPTSLVKPFRAKNVDQRHPMADKFAFQA